MGENRDGEGRGMNYPVTQEILLDFLRWVLRLPK